jgi:hypothetical protein
MTKTECRTKLKHQLEIGRRLQQAGLYTAAAESRKKAVVLLHGYRNHYPKESRSLH